MFKDQKQQVSDGGTAVQAGGSVTIIQHGLSLSEFRQVALDVFRANFYELSEGAKNIAKARAEEVTEEFLSKLQKINPAGFDKANDPDFQYALFTVQKEYARSGDKALGDLLVELLIDRSKQDQRDILQIVLNESLNTAPKLTENQLATLAIVFLFRYTQNFRLGNHELLGRYFDDHVKPFTSKLRKNISEFQHLEFCGCGSTGLASRTLEGILGTNYQGQFLKGFSKTEFVEREVVVSAYQDFFMPCLNDASLFQVSANSKELLQERLEAIKAPEEERNKIGALFDLNKMSDDEIKAKCIAIRPYMADVFDVWNNSAMARFTLTSVGIAIGHASVKRYVGDYASLSIWID